eukprot:COSAG02_NODE_411_length_22864_cov_6.757523_1_plen_74_part_00
MQLCNRMWVAATTVPLGGGNYPQRWELPSPRRQCTYTVVYTAESALEASRTVGLGSSPVDIGITFQPSLGGVS